MMWGAMEGHVVAMVGGGNACRLSPGGPRGCSLPNHPIRGSEVLSSKSGTVIFEGGMGEGIPFEVQSVVPYAYPFIFQVVDYFVGRTFHMARNDGIYSGNKAHDAFQCRLQSP